MKAAVINGFGEILQYREFTDPVPRKDEVLVDVKASVLENFDNFTASGIHYSSQQFPKFAAIPRTAGVRTMPDGKLVAFGNIQSPYGVFAEKVTGQFECFSVCSDSWEFFTTTSLKSLIERGKGKDISKDEDSYTTSFVTDRSPEEVFNAINNVRGWWSEEIQGKTDELDAEFFYHYRDVHLSKLRKNMNVMMFSRMPGPAISRSV